MDIGRAQPSPGDSDGSPEVEEDPFQRAYRAYLTAIQRAWANVDIDSVVNSDLGITLALGCYGTAGTAGTVGSAGGTLGSFGSVGTFGTHSLQPMWATVASSGTAGCSLVVAPAGPPGLRESSGPE